MMLSPPAYELQDCVPLDWFCEALSHAAAKLDKANKRTAPNDIVFAAIMDAVATVRLLPDERSGWTDFLPMPRWLEDDEDRKMRLARYVRVLQRVHHGEIKAKASPEAVRRLMAVRAHAPTGMTRPNGPQTGPVKPMSRDLADDWRVLILLGTGASAKRVARDHFSLVWGMSASSIERRRDLQLTAIAQTFAFLIPRAYAA